MSSRSTLDIPYLVILEDMCLETAEVAKLIDWKYSRGRGNACINFSAQWIVFIYYSYSSSLIFVTFCVRSVLQENIHLLVEEVHVWHLNVAKASTVTINSFYQNSQPWLSLNTTLSLGVVMYDCKIWPKVHVSFNNPKLWKKC